jgi:hypothetical protein
MFALRSAGFADVPDSIVVHLIGNRFEWAGSNGLGFMLGSHANRLRIESNTFVNVICDMRYKSAGRVEIIDNDFRFTMSAERTGNLVAIGRNGDGGGEISGNVIDVRARQPEGSAAILVEDSSSLTPVKVSKNRVLESGGNQVTWPLLVADVSARVMVEDNEVRALYTSGPRKMLQFVRNRTAAGADAPLSEKPAAPPDPA